MFDFDRVIERRGTHATKWDNMAKLSGIDAGCDPDVGSRHGFRRAPGRDGGAGAEVERAPTATTPIPGSWAAALVDWMARRHGLTWIPAG